METSICAEPSSFTVMSHFSVSLSLYFSGRSITSSLPLSRGRSIPWSKALVPNCAYSFWSFSQMSLPLTFTFTSHVSKRSVDGYFW